MQKLILGHIVNPISDEKCQFIPHGGILLSKKSKKWTIEKLGKAKALREDFTGETIDLGNKLILPPFFDMHFHWVQDEVRQMPKADLLEWLNEYTFPTEAKFKSAKLSKNLAKAFFKRIIATGTMGGACYSSIHEHALEDAFEYAVGDYIIGNVLMTINSPDYLTQKPQDAVDLVDKLSKKYKSRYAFTPRFAIATDPQTMSAGAKFAKENNSFMQTHLSETKNEIEFVKSIYSEIEGFERVESYTHIYEKCGMLGPKTIMGHGIHLSFKELELLSNTQTAIAHCPTSNAPHKQKGLGSGLFNFKLIEKYSIPWALGSDIGGGPYLSMLDVMRSFVQQNKKNDVKEATYIKALFRSTLAGAQILGLEETKGNLGVGKEASFITLDLKRERISDESCAETLLEKLIEKQTDRSQYDAMVNDVFYLGERIELS